MDTDIIWKDIPEYKGIYQVSNIGDILSVKKNKKRKLALDKDGYPKVDLWKKGKGKNYFVHRLVAIAFIPNTNNKPCVNHKDGTKNNNRVENIEWVTASENTQHAYDVGLMKPPMNMLGIKGEDNHSSKSGKIRMPDGSILIYKSQADLVREFNLHAGDLSKVINGKRNICKGWTGV